MTSEKDAVVDIVELRFRLFGSFLSHIIADRGFGMLNVVGIELTINLKKN